MFESRKSLYTIEAWEGKKVLGCLSEHMKLIKK